jgi:hypothetical protein
MCKKIFFLLISLLQFPVWAMDESENCSRIKACAEFFLSVAGYKHLDPDKQIAYARKVLGVSKEFADKKFAYAYFLDRYEPQDESEYNQLNKFTNLEYFAGSISAKKLTDYLSLFVKNDDYSKKFSAKFISAVKDSIKAIERGQEQSVKLDAIRASDLKLALLAAGIDIPFIQKKNYGKVIDDLIGYTKNQINKLKDSESILLSGGSLMHENRLKIKRIKDDRFELWHFDSVYEFGPKVFTDVSKEEILDSDFLRRYYEQKLECRGYFAEVKDQNNKKCFASRFFEENQTLHKKRLSKTSPAILLSGLARQKRSTCHLRGLIAALKGNLIEQFEKNPTETTLEWQRFKFLFGKFILNEMNLKDKDLKALCLQALEKFGKKIKFYKRLFSVEKSGDFKKTKDAYKKLLVNWFPAISPLYECDDLVSLHKELSFQIANNFHNQYSVRFLIRISENKMLKESIAKLSKKFEMAAFKKAMLQKQISNELKYAHPKNSPFMGYHIGFSFPQINWFQKSQLFSSNGLSDDEIKSYLQEINSYYIVDLSRKPHICWVLMLACSREMFAEINDIYENLVKCDQQQLEFMLWMSAYNPTKRVNIIEHSRKDEIIEALKNTKNQGLFTHYLSSLIKSKDNFCNAFLKDEELAALIGTFIDNKWEFGMNKIFDLLQPGCQKRFFDIFYELCNPNDQKISNSI